MSKIRQTETPNNSGELSQNPIFLSRQDLRDLGIRVSPSTLIRWQNANRFPKAVRLGGTSLAWRYDEIMKWCEERTEEAKHFTYADF